MNETLKCVLCGESAVQEKTQTERFEYLISGKSVVLSADVPVIGCGVCGLAYTDDRAEAIRLETINKVAKSVA